MTLAIDDRVCRFTLCFDASPVHGSSDYILPLSEAKNMLEIYFMASPSGCVSVKDLRIENSLDALKQSKNYLIGRPSLPQLAYSLIDLYEKGAKINGELVTLHPSRVKQLPPPPSLIDFSSSISETKSTG